MTFTEYVSRHRVGADPRGDFFRRTQKLIIRGELPDVKIM